MSWNLLIYRGGEDGDTAPLGNLPTVTKAMDSAFTGLIWPSELECELAEEGGFAITWTLEDEEVRDGYTSGGFNHLKQLAALCKKQGWQLADAQEGEEIDLDDPLASFGGHPCLCIGTSMGMVEGISLVDGSFPRQCGVPQCGVRKLSHEEAIQWKFFGPPDVPPELEMTEEQKYWLKDQDYARGFWPRKNEG